VVEELSHVSARSPLGWILDHKQWVGAKSKLKMQICIISSAEWPLVLENSLSLIKKVPENPSLGTARG